MTMDKGGAAFVTIKGLTKRFGDFRAVDDVSFEVAEGGTLALLGPSGCGKTTILRCIAGLERPDAGFISIADKVVFDAEGGVNLMPEQRGLGVVFQSYAVWPHMTVAENVAFPLRVRGMDVAQRRAKAQAILETVGLAGFATRPATQLSGGQQQRVALARALVHEPALVLFDEALSNLDAALREQMRLELKALQDRLGFTAVYVTHDQAEALGLAQSVLLMNAGRIEASGTARGVFSSVSSLFAARFFGLNVLEGEVSAVGDGGLIDFACGPVRLKARAGPQEVKVGDRVSVGIHREHVVLRPAGSAAAAAGDGRAVLPGVVRTSSFQGLHEEYMIELSQGVTLRSLQPVMELARGAAVDVVVEADRVVALRNQ